jgi:type IV pilus assembly protein PilQ
MNDPRTLLGAVTIPPTNQEFDAKLSAALGSGRAEMVAMPRVVTNNGKEAMIQQGIEFPAQQSSVESSKGIPVAKIRKAVLTLKITPKVAANNRIELDLDALMHDFDSSEKGETHRIVTKAEMNDGYTVVLDGLLLVEKPDSGFPAPISKTPKSRRQLVVLLTPTLLPKQEPLYPTTL